MTNLLENCCICLKKCELAQKLSECGSSSEKFEEKLQTLLPSEVWKEHYLICAKCIEKLNEAYDFLQICLKSEKYRKEGCHCDTSKTKNTPDKKSKAGAGLHTNINSNVENINIDIKSEQSHYSCNMCNKSFKLKRTLNLHITRVHIRTKRQIKQESVSASKINEPTNVENKSDNESLKNRTEDSGSLKDISLFYKNEEESTFNNDFCNSGDEGCGDNEESGETTTEENRLQEIKREIKGEGEVKEKNDIKSNQSNETKSFHKTRKKRKLKERILCDHCNMLFTNMDKYQLHVRVKHAHEQPFHCDECDAKYFSKQSLQIHKRKHSNEKPYICSKCGKSFVSSNDLWQHNKIHDVIRQYPCDKCDRSFKTHSNLRTHKHQMHLDPTLWKFICKVCGKKFPLNTNLIKHLRRHEGIKPYGCNLCEKRFVEKVDLQVHIVSHSNERLFKCTLCEKDYKKRENLRRHQKTEHNIGSIKIKKPEKKLTCPRCPKLFAFNNKLQRHLLTHTGERPVGCDFCEKRFRDNYDRNTHLKKEHNMQAPF